MCEGESLMHSSGHPLLPWKYENKELEEQQYPGGIQ
jgi:hypothetical protein